MNTFDAVEFIKELAALQDPDFMNVRRYLESNGFSLSTDGARARAWCLNEAAEGNVQAQYVSSAILSAGLFGSMEKLEALRLCRLAAEKSYPPALLLLSQFYESGWGDVDVDSEKAYELMQEAARLGYLPALVASAGFPLDAGNDRQVSERIEILQRAAEHDYVPAQSALASELISSGRSGEGLRWLRRAAAAGYPHAHRMLGYFYKGGEHGLPKDEEMAESHFKRAADSERRSWDGLF